MCGESMQSGSKKGSEGRKMGGCGGEGVAAQQLLYLLSFLPSPPLL